MLDHLSWSVWRPLKPLLPLDLRACVLLHLTLHLSWGMTARGQTGFVQYSEAPSRCWTNGSHTPLWCWGRVQEGGGWTEFPPSAFQTGLRHMVDDRVRRLVLSSFFIECRNKSPWRLRAGGTGHLSASNQDQMPPASTSNCP